MCFPTSRYLTVVIMTDAKGMASEEVERLVTFPIETAVNGATEAECVPPLCRAIPSCGWNLTGGHRYIQGASDCFGKDGGSRRVAARRNHTYACTSVKCDGEILFIGLQSDSTSMMELRTLADWVIKPAILATGGVSQVTNIGGELKQYQILADPQKMDFYGVTMEELEEVGKSFSVNSVGGVIRDYGNEYALRGMGRTTDLEALGSTLVKTRNGKPVVLSDVAEVKTGAAVRMGIIAKRQAGGHSVRVQATQYQYPLKLQSRLRRILRQSRSHFRQT